MGVGPFQLGETVRIPLEVTLNGKAYAVSNPRVQRLILPSGMDASGFPATMTALKDGTYIYEFTANYLGSYLAIINAEVGTDTIEQIEPFVVESPFGYPRIEVATDSD